MMKDGYTHKHTLLPAIGAVCLFYFDSGYLSLYDKKSALKVHSELLLKPINF